MFQFPGFASYPYEFRIRSALRLGLPHSEIHGSKGARPSPRLIAACHVLHRLSEPRHPPDALTSLDRHPSCTGSFPRPNLLTQFGHVSTWLRTNPTRFARVIRGLMLSITRPTIQSFQLPGTLNQRTSPRLHNTRSSLVQQRRTLLSTMMVRSAPPNPTRSWRQTASTNRAEE